MAAFSIYIYRSISAMCYIYHCSYVIEGSATIPYHIDGFRNHLDTLLESENQVEIFESRIIISMFMLGY